VVCYTSPSRICSSYSDTLMGGLQKSKERNLDVRHVFFWESLILSSTAGDGCSKRIKLLRDRGWGSGGGGGGGGGEQMKDSIFITKSLGAKNSAPRGLVA